LDLTKGIGLALAEKYAETGTHVVAVGRRQENLDQLANKHKGKISTKVFDIAALDKIPKFVDEVIAEHPDLECVFLNRYVLRDVMLLTRQWNSTWIQFHET
jgi:short-subunit dehydrogenase involved in D-alanine esterification of teichoic acids